MMLKQVAVFWVYLVHTVKQENCAVVLLYVLMDDTPTIDDIFVRFFYLCVFFVYKNAGVRVFYRAVNHCPHI